MNSETSPFEAFLRAVAKHYTRNNPQPEQAYLAMVSTLYSIAAEKCGGEWVYVRRGNALEQHQVRERIVQAIQAGEPTDVVAQREGVHRTTVRRIVGRIGG